MFVKNWYIFQKIIKNNYMRYKEMYNVLYQFIFNYLDKLFFFLDLGCGDLLIIIFCFIDSDIYSYIGVDLLL